jgi:hypothetical protein
MSTNEKLKLVGAQFTDKQFQKIGESAMENPLIRFLMLDAPKDEIANISDQFSQWMTDVAKYRRSTRFSVEVSGLSRKGDMPGDPVYFGISYKRPQIDAPAKAVGRYVKDGVASKTDPKSLMDID